MQDTRKPAKNPPKPPVYKAALDLDVQYCRSTKKAPQDVKYMHINRLHDALIEIVTAIAFANETQDAQERADFISRAADDLRNMKIRVRVLYDLHYITKKGFTAISGTEENVARQLAGWQKSTEDRINNPIVKQSLAE